MSTTTETITSTGELAGREPTDTGRSERGVGGAVLKTAAYVVRQLAGCLAIIVLVWLVVLLFRHVQTVAFILAGVLLALVGVGLFVRNRRLTH